MRAALHVIAVSFLPVILASAGRTPASEQTVTGPGEPNKTSDEVARLRAMAEGLAGPKKEEKSPDETIYKPRGLSLQQLNPEISVSGGGRLRSLLAAGPIQIKAMSRTYRPEECCDDCAM